MMLERKGIILAGGAGTRLYPVTMAVSKQLLPVWDKPMVYYPLSVLMLAGIQDILLISTPHDLPLFQKVLGDGSQFGIRLSYAEQPSPDGLAQALIIAEDFLAGSPSALVLGDNIFYGANFSQRLQEANRRRVGATAFATLVEDPHRYGIVTFGTDGRPATLEEKPPEPKSRWAVTGLYFFDEHAPQHAKQLTPSPRGELEITDLNRVYLNHGVLQVEKLGRGYAWFDTGTHASLLQAAGFMQALEERQGVKVGCPEEIAYHAGWLDAAALEAHLSVLGQGHYATYLKRLLESDWMD
jgi:glucose-1-phosphate thymidylyltransferase